MPNDICPICHVAIDPIEPSSGDYEVISCKMCGKYKISRDAILRVDSINDDDKRWLLSHKVFWMNRKNEDPFLFESIIDGLIKLPFPDIFEQQNTFIKWFGENSSYGKNEVLTFQMFRSIFGCKNLDGHIFLLRYLEEIELIQIFSGQISNHDGGAHIQLTVKGWVYFNELKKGIIQSKNVFMAMQYGNTELDDLVEKYVKPAVKATGFDLVKLIDSQPAGLIDDNLRVYLRNSKFTIADLSVENLNVLWEAGFSEGLGKKVIFICKSDIFKSSKFPFDINHLLTVIYNSDNMLKFVSDLKNTIRATFPDEAIMLDDNK